MAFFPFFVTFKLPFFSDNAFASSVSFMKSCFLLLWGGSSHLLLHSVKNISHPSKHESRIWFLSEFLFHYFFFLLLMIGRKRTELWHEEVFCRHRIFYHFHVFTFKVYRRETGEKSCLLKTSMSHTRNLSWKWSFLHF